MDISEQRQRWSQMLAQAAGFLDTDNTIDALARARRCLHEMRETLERATNAATRKELQKLIAQAEARVQHYQAKHAEWNARVTERREKYLAREHDVYENELPLPGVD